MTILKRFFYKNSDLEFLGGFMVDGVEVEGACAPETRQDLRTLLAGLPSKALLRFAEYCAGAGDDELLSAIGAQDVQKIVEITCEEIEEEMIPSVIFGLVDSENIVFISDTYQGMPGDMP